MGNCSQANNFTQNFETYLLIFMLSINYFTQVEIYVGKCRISYISGNLKRYLIKNINFMKGIHISSALEVSHV